jgi:hypothetical protein
MNLKGTGGEDIAILRHTHTRVLREQLLGDVVGGGGYHLVISRDIVNNWLHYQHRSANRSEARLKAEAKVRETCSSISASAWSSFPSTYNCPAL